MVAKEQFIPERGDIIWISLSPTRGHEQSGRRPALVLSPAFYNEQNGTAIICPITSKQKGHPFEVLVKTSKISGVVLSDQIRVVDWKTRKISFVTGAHPSVVNEVVEKVSFLLKG